MITYFKQIWAARYFWSNLALADLRARWRRSFFGMLWSMLQPLGMTALLALVFSRMFHTDIVSYAPYILSGVIIWEFVSSSLTGGSLSFVQADAYIRQCRHPLAIYTLRTVLTALIVLTMASIPLLIWSLAVLPEKFGLCWLAVLTLYPVLLLMAWPLATILAYVGARFRDVPHAMALILQALWFISPVYFQASMFRKGGLDALVDYNPVYHLLQIVRAPLLDGEWPTVTNYAFTLGAACIFTLLAWAIGRTAEKRVIFYL